MTTKESSRHRQSTVTVVRKFKVHWRRLSKGSKCAYLPGHPSGIFPLWGICHRIYPGVGMGIRPFPSCPKLLFQREAKCNDIQFSCNKSHFHEKRFVLSFEREIFWNSENAYLSLFSSNPNTFNIMHDQLVPPWQISGRGPRVNTWYWGTVMFWPRMMCW